MSTCSRSLRRTGDQEHCQQRASEKGLQALGLEESGRKDVVHRDFFENMKTKKLFLLKGSDILTFERRRQSLRICLKP